MCAKVSLTMAENKTSVDLTKEDKDASLTWDEATWTWADATSKWDAPALTLTKESKTKKDLTLAENK